MDYSQTGDVISGLALIIDIALIAFITILMFRKD